MAPRPPEPLKTRAYLMLLALAEEDRHGLAIARAVDDLSEGRVRLWPAALYGTLQDLVDRGWIAEVVAASSRPVNATEKQRFYRLTRAGTRVLSAETERLGSLVKIARSRLKPHTGSA